MLALEEDSIAAHLICMQALPNPPYSVRLVVSSYKANYQCACSTCCTKTDVDVVPWISQQLLITFSVYCACVHHAFTRVHCTSESEFCSYMCCTIVCVAINQFTFVHS